MYSLASIQTQQVGCCGKELSKKVNNKETICKFCSEKKFKRSPSLDSFVFLRCYSQVNQKKIFRTYYFPRVSFETYVYRWEHLQFHVLTRTRVCASTSVCVYIGICIPWVRFFIVSNSGSNVFLNLFDFCGALSTNCARDIWQLNPCGLLWSFLLFHLFGLL